MARMTIQRALILRAMLETPLEDWYGLELAETAGLKTGTIYPALAALEQTGLLTSTWEEIDPAHEGRPRRRFYRLVPERVADARSYVDQFDVALNPTRAPARGSLRVLPRSQTA